MAGGSRVGSGHGAKRTHDRPNTVRNYPLQDVSLLYNFMVLRFSAD
jgi:hypothetical protein